MLTPEQQRFLARYINSRGDFYQTVDSLGLDLCHVMSWQETNPEFDLEYRKARTGVIDFLKQENFLLATRKVNDALKNGVQTQTVTQKHQINSDGESEFVTNRTTKHLGVPGWAVIEALKESSLSKAIQTLANEGVLPTPIARKLLQNVGLIQPKIKESFDIKDSDFVNEQKAISLIKAAVLGEVDV